MNFLASWMTLEMASRSLVLSLGHSTSGEVWKDTVTQQDYIQFDNHVNWIKKRVNLGSKRNSGITSAIA